jgi:hypothetical protein
MVLIDFGSFSHLLKLFAFYAKRAFWVFFFGAKSMEYRLFSHLFKKVCIIEICMLQCSELVEL